MFHSYIISHIYIYTCHPSEGPVPIFDQDCTSTAVGTEVVFRDGAEEPWWGSKVDGCNIWLYIDVNIWLIYVNMVNIC
jgi:hypothetical protein